MPIGYSDTIKCMSEYPTYTAFLLLYRGNRGYGKRSTSTDNISAGEELDSVTRKIVDLFHRASQMDEEQCVSRLICEVNADSDSAKSV